MKLGWLFDIQLTFLDQVAVRRLFRQLAACDVDGWADGRFGNALEAPVELNDFRLIEELAGAAYGSPVVQELFGFGGGS